MELATDLSTGVLKHRDTRITALLRTPVYTAIFRDVKITRAGAALPVVWLTVHQIFLE